MRDNISVLLWLIVLFSIIEVTGTTFFGIDYSPLIILALVVIAIIVKWKDTKDLVNLILKLFKR